MGRRPNLDRELDELDEALRDVQPGGRYWAHRIRMLCERGQYVEAMARILDPPFWWYDQDGVTRGERYAICGEWSLIEAMIRAARKAELQRAKQERERRKGS